MILEYSEGYRRNKSFQAAVNRKAVKKKVDLSIEDWELWCFAVLEAIPT
jgi:hypothetical protein